MQIAKCLLAACAVAATLPLATQADTEAQMKARQALEQKLNELQPQAPAAAPKAPAVAQPAPKPAVPPPAAKQPKSTSAQPVPPMNAQEPVFAGQAQSTPQGRIADPDTIEKAREAMRQKVQELPPATEGPTAASQSVPVAPAHSEPVVVPPVSAPSAVTTPPVAAAPATSPPPKVHGTKSSVSDDARFSNTETLPSANPDADAKAREALHEKMLQVEPQPVVAAAPKTFHQSAQPAEPAAAANVHPVSQTSPPVAVVPPKKPKMSKAFDPLEGPASPISAEKNQRLADLLQKYKSDQITPEEYHAERAKILAGQ